METKMLKKFNSLPLHRSTKDFLVEKKYEYMTPVQQATIPLFLQKRRDVVVEACTGSGKTMSYLIPLIEMLLDNPSLQNPVKKAEISTSKSNASLEKLTVAAIILLPTRELALQVFQILNHYLSFLPCKNTQMDTFTKLNTKALKKDGDERKKSIKDESEQLIPFLRSLLLRGGRDIEIDIQKINEMTVKNNTVIIVGTPGRISGILDEYKTQPKFEIRSLQMAILDEADRLLDMGSSLHLNNILNILPKHRRTGLFSATLSQEVQQLVKIGLRNPAFITVRTQANDLQPNKDSSTSNVQHTTPPQLKNYFLKTLSTEKLPFLVSFIREIIIREKRKVIIFVLTCKYVEYVHHLLCYIFDKLNKETSYLECDKNQNSTKQSKVCPMSSEASTFLHKENNTLTNPIKEIVMEEDSKLINEERSLSFNKENTESNTVNFFPKTSKSFPKMDLNPYLKGSNSTYSKPNYTSFIIEKMHGKMTQQNRRGAFRRFRESECGVLISTDLMSRGIDVPNIDWIIQADAPQDPSSFVHRIGRTARGGESGSSLLLVNENEVEYISFLSGRKVHLEELRCAKLSLPTQEEISYLHHHCTKRIISDRTILMKGIKAFVSYIRAYSEHQLTSIFSLKQLDLGRLATSFYLLRIPRIKEILGKTIHNFTQSNIDPLTIPYKDPKLETIRQNNLEKLLQHREQIKHNKIKTQQKLLQKQAHQNSRTRGDKRQAKRTNKLSEWADLQHEERMHKKWKARKISLQDYESHLTSIKPSFNETDDDNDNDIAKSYLQSPLKKFTGIRKANKRVKKFQKQRFRNKKRKTK